MKIGLIGLGRMGGNMGKRLVQHGHQVVAYARRQESRDGAAEWGGEPAGSLEELCSLLPRPRVVWLMVPAGPPVDQVLDDLAPLMERGDIVIDGGNSFYGETVERAARLGQKGIRMVDVGTSGGIWGLKEGYSMMVGGEEDVVETIRPILEALAPSPDRGWGRVGPVGSGHFVKMVHNGIEYGMMQAYAEGFSLLRSKEEFGLDLAQIASIWEHGSVVRSWLLELIRDILERDQSLDTLEPWIDDSGEGRWTVMEGIQQSVPLPCITLSLLQRFDSRGGGDFGNRLLAALRNSFGGHPVKERS